MSRHVVVVGAGVIGLATAYYCAQRGMRVTVLDRNGAARDGCSFQNAGMVVPSHFVPLAAPGMVSLALKWMWNPASPFYIKPRASLELVDWGLKFWRAANAIHVRRAAPLLRDLSLASRACYEQLAQQGQFGFERRGTLVLCKTRHALEEEAAVAAQGRALGLRAELVDARELAALEPGVRMDVAGAIHFPDDANLEPRLLIEFLERRLAEAGVELGGNAEASGWRTNGAIRAVQLRDGSEVSGDEFVLCAGAWSSPLAAKLGLRLPLQAGKGYSLTLEKPPRAPRRCAILSEARVAVSPMNGKLRFAGTMELAGLDEAINPIRVRGIVEAVQRYYPDFGERHFAGIEPWRGLRPCTPDGLPYLGRTTRASNLIVATGHAMMGVSLAPITGRIVTDLIEGKPGEMDLSLLSPDRYP